MVAAHALDFEAGQKHESQEQHFVNGQSLDLSLKNFKMILPKTKWHHEEWTSESLHSEYSEVFIKCIHLKALLLLRVYC